MGSPARPRGALIFAVPSSGPVSSPAPARVWDTKAVSVGVPALAALAYALGHLGWYLTTPLGRVPVLDERENIDLATAIFQGTLPALPFYRAPGYALALAGMRACGVSAAGLFPAALLLGVLLHGAGAALAAIAARRLFGGAAGLASGLLFALDPVLVHFATQAVDATLGMALFLGGFALLPGLRAGTPRPRDWIAPSLFWAAATLARPNYLLSWIVLPLLALATAPRGRLRMAAAAAALAGAAFFAAQGAWQWHICRDPGFLPWQGPYNLWAANRPGANGRFFVQQESLPPELARANPARVESILLYERETHGAPATIPLMSAFWRGRFISHVLSHPLQWCRLLARKTYALADNWEQYNNKTFAFHKALSPWLRWNPICWGLVLVLALAGGARLRAESPGKLLPVTAAALSCAAAVILFFASARFRLPLAAIGCVLAGGALAAPRFWAGWAPGRRLALAAACAATLAVSFSRFGNVASPETMVQDHVLLARAAYTVGDDPLALAEARAALAMQPWHPDARVIERQAQTALAGKQAQ